MDLMKLGTQLLMSKLGGGAQQADNNAIQSALGSLLGAGNSLDIAGLVNSLQSGGLGDVAKSWLGDGANEAISPEQIKQVVDGEKLNQLAAVAHTDEGSILSALQDAMPQMVDKASSGGSLLDSIGGLAGAANLAKGFLK